MKKTIKKEVAEGHQHQVAALRTPTDLKVAATKDIAASMNGILADVFALYLKTKNVEASGILTVRANPTLIGGL